MHQLTGLTYNLTINANNKKCTTTVFLDTEKAFDKVWRNRLLFKIHTLNTPVYLLKIIQSFLTNKSFKIKKNTELYPTDAKSKPALHKAYFLSPIFYSAYTNDIPLNTNAKLHLFVDDTMYATSNIHPIRAIS